MNSLHLTHSLSSTEGLIFVFAVTVAVAGIFVAALAFLGYRRNGSRPMLYLAGGIVLLTTVPVGIDTGLSALTAATDASILLGVTIAHLFGVVAILYALTNA